MSRRARVAGLHGDATVIGVTAGSTVGGIEIVRTYTIGRGIR